MKRIYTTLSLLALLASGAYAQDIDLEAVAELGVPADEAAGQKLCLGKHLSPRPDAPDSIYGIYGIQFNGPDDLFVDDRVNFRSSFHHFLTQAEADAQVPPVLLSEKYAWYSGMAVAQNHIDNGGFLFSYESIDSIGMLIDWARYQELGLDSIRTLGPPHETFQNGQAYGFFVRTWGIGASANAIENNDDNMENNWKIIKILWNECATSLADLVAKREMVDISVYPNPTESDINVKYSFKQNANVEILVRDITGKVVASKNVGHVTVGDRSFNLNVANLASGMYTIEMNAGDFAGISKFNKK